jgi:molybdenum cofactor biosynthesis enzyme
MLETRRLPSELRWPERLCLCREKWHSSSKEAVRWILILLFSLSLSLSLSLSDIGTNSCHVVRSVLQNLGNELFSAKGAVFSTATIAGTLGVKQTPLLIPFCHPLAVDYCNISLSLDPTTPTSDGALKAPSSSSTCRDDKGKAHIHILCEVRCEGKTGVEMEALTGASVAALCVIDMCKSATKDIAIEDVRLLRKTGGKSSDWQLSE